MESDVRALLEKAASPLWHCLVRVAVTSPSREAARGHIHGLAGALAVFEGPNGFRRRRFPGAGRRMRARALTRPYLLSVPEMAQVATLPSAGAVEGLERASAGTVAPPRGLPTEGKVLGRAEGPGRRAVAISVEDARHHVHVIGETGTGKSTLLANLVLQDAAAGRSAVVIDPMGDLVESVIERLPAGAKDRTCLLDPDDSPSREGKFDGIHSSTRKRSPESESVPAFRSHYVGVPEGPECADLTLEEHGHESLMILRCADDLHGDLGQVGVEVGRGIHIGHSPPRYGRLTERVPPVDDPGHSLIPRGPDGESATHFVNLIPRADTEEPKLAV